MSSGTFTHAVPGFSVVRLRQLALEGLDRTRFAVHAVPVKGIHGAYTIATEPESTNAGLSRDDAERYAASITNEAELARAMVLVLAELERLAGELETLRRNDRSIE